MGRTKNMEPYLTQSGATKILIDHHLEPQPIFDYGISDTKAAATAELIFRVIGLLGDKHLIDLNMAQCIYAGTVTDTGSFRFKSTTAAVHRMVADLMDLGLEHELVHQAVYDNFLENRLRFLGHSLLHRMEVFYQTNTAIMAIPYADLKRFDLSTGDTEGLANFLLSIQGIKLAALIIDRNVEVKMSFRSKGNFDVNQFARKYFQGGGHFNAAGGRSTDSLEGTVNRFIHAMNENEEQLQ
jgi:phosphoesterase RecJ-like protein